MPRVLPLDHSAQGLAEHVSVGTRSVVTDYLKIQSDAITRVYKMENFVGEKEIAKDKIGDCNLWRCSMESRVPACGSA